MIYGRVIGNELRDIPPECLPVWGQRWSGYRAPHGPSPFSTRVFSVDRMSEVGPALTSPSQFEMTLADEDEGEDTSSESSRLYSLFSSSPLAIQTGATELTSRPKAPTPRSMHRLSNHPHGSPQILHRSIRYLPPPSSTCFNTTLLPRRQSEQSDTQHHTSKPLLHTPPLHYSIPFQGSRGSFENDLSIWDMDRTSTSIQPSHASDVPSGQLQLQHTIPPHSVPEWQFANAHTQSSAYYPFQPNPSSHPDSGYPFQPFPDDDQTRFIPAASPSSSHFFTMPLFQQNVGIDSCWDHDSGTTRIPGIAHHRNHMTAQWPSGPVLPGTSQNSGSSLGPARVFYHLASDHGSSSHPEDLLDTFPRPEGCTLLLLDKPGDDQFTR